MKTFISGSKSIRVINDRILKELYTITERGDELIVGDCFGADVVVQDYLTASLYPNVIVYSRENKVRYNIGGWVVKCTSESENAPYYEILRQRLALAKAIDNVLIIWDGKSEDELHKMKLFAEVGKTYNHKLLWEYIKPRNKPFDYYPRGRVDYNAKGKAIIYMNPNISAEYIDKIKIAFGIDSEPVIRYDHSEHYKCHIDR